jgi:prolipoprotein diacylglyceryl transferase
VWELGPIPVRAYALCIIVGIVVAAIWGNRRLVARGGRPGAITDLAVWMVPFGLIGGRLYHLITDPEIYFYPSAANGYHAQPWKAFAIWDGGLGIWGAIALGALGAYLGARRYKIPFGSIADALAPAIVLAQAIGRLGNYFNQELFGSPTTVPWALQVFLRTPGGVAGDVSQCGTGEFPTEWIKASPTVLCGTYHPTFLYELLWDVLVALVVVWADRRFRLGHGRAFALYVAGYCVGRGWIEMLRIDHANHILGLRLNVFVSAAVFLAAVIYLVATRRFGREDPATVFGVVPGASRSGGAAAGTGGDDDETSETAGNSGAAAESGDDATGDASDAGDGSREDAPDGGDGSPEEALDGGDGSPEEALDGGDEGSAVASNSRHEDAHGADITSDEATPSADDEADPARS